MLRMEFLGTIADPIRSASGGDFEQQLLDLQWRTLGRKASWDGVSEP